MGGPPISPETERRIALLFSPEQQPIVSTILRDECGHSLPGCKDFNMERIRFAVLKLSAGSLDQLKDAVRWTQADWRDVLVWAGFGDDVAAHESWLPQ